MSIPDPATTEWVPLWSPNAASPGNVFGPATATDSAIALYDGTTGKLLKNSTTLLSGLAAKPVPVADGGTGVTTGLTQLNASNLTSGTVADARLSANVALRDNANNFSANQYIAKAVPILYLNDTSQPVDGRKFSFAAYNQEFYIQAVNDAETTSVNTFVLNRLGDLKAVRDVVVGRGLQFPTPAVATANPTTLDDYREGVWTPTDASGAGLVFSYAAGGYTKIGRTVFIQGQVLFPATANAAAWSVGGLPYANVLGNAPLTIGFLAMVPPFIQLTLFAIGGTTTIALAAYGNGAYPTNAQMTTCNLVFGGFYITS